MHVGYLADNVSYRYRPTIITVGFVIIIVHFNHGEMLKYVWESPG